jgi:hypothetical protein
VSGKSALDFAVDGERRLQVVEEPSEGGVKDVFECPLKAVESLLTGQHRREAKVGFDHWATVNDLSIIILEKLRATAQHFSKSRLTESRFDMLPSFSPHCLALEPHLLISWFVDRDTQHAVRKREDIVSPRAAFRKHNYVANFDVRVEELAGDKVQGLHVDACILKYAVAGR